MVENGRGWWHFSSPKEAPYIASSITLSSLSPHLRSHYLFRCRSAYWDAIVAPTENTRCAWKRVKRSSPLNGEQKKKSPFSFSRCKLVHSYTLFAECFRSIQEESGIRQAGVLEDGDPRILKLKDLRNWNRFTLFFKEVSPFKCFYRNKMDALSARKMERRILHRAFLFRDYTSIVLLCSAFFFSLKKYIIEKCMKYFLKLYRAAFLMPLLCIHVAPLLSYFFYDTAGDSCELRGLTRETGVYVSSHVTLSRDLFGVS